MTSPRPRPKLAAGAFAALTLVTGARALSCEDARAPIVRFIDIYRATEQAESLQMGWWQRIWVSYSAAKHPPARAAVCPPPSDSFLAD
ncbi:MAG: hypothetical protein JSU00_30410 [Acidobacteria bacterium]|nr:hypothetical protein [Acidobacteriota bacterium]